MSKEFYEHGFAFTCIVCGYTMDSSGVTDSNEYQVPEEGDITLCLNCASMYMYDEHLSIRPVTEFELQQMKKEDPEYYLHCIKEQQRLRDYNRHRKGN